MIVMKSLYDFKDFLHLQCDLHLQISDAKITITDPKPGAVETKIIISGTPEQTHAAQSLIQAFVMSERESG